jgi:transcriptional regulator with XRE-family HTH domain
MVTRIRAKSARRQHLYIAEWMKERGLSDERLAGRLGVDRVTITRYRTQQHRLNPDKIAAIAMALDVPPESLWRPPAANRPSIDVLLKDAPDEAVKQLARVAEVLLKTGS